MAKDHNISKEELGFLDMAFRGDTSNTEYRRNERVPVGTFGIIDQDGCEITYTWVQSSLARRVKPEPPALKSDWYKYLEQTMFRSWNNPKQSVQ